MQREPLRERMRGRWHGVLPELGVPPTFLTGKHQPCPLCGGKDRARFDNKDGAGTWICSHCGAGDGVSLVMKINGWDFKMTAERIEAIAGDVQVRAPRSKEDPRKQLRAIRETWNRGNPQLTVVSRYLLSRGIEADYLLNVRELGNEMLALLRDANGVPCQMHRTILTPEGKRDTRLFMPGPIPKGSSVRLMQCEDVLGVAEGIETALSAAILFDVPVWAALNTSMLKTFEPPEGLKRLYVFGDNDANCAGQAAAYELARRLASHVEVSVEIPEEVGCDWNDDLMNHVAARKAG
jgi:putative DNA primase/helicase